MATNKKKSAETTETKAKANQARANKTDDVENMMKSGMDAAAKGYEQAFSHSQAQAEKVMETLTKQFGNTEWANSSNGFTESYQKFNNLFMGMAQDVMKKNFAVTEAILGAKDFNEVTEIQSNFARESFDSMVKNGTELTALSTELVNEVAEPVRKQVAEAVEKMTKATA